MNAVDTIIFGGASVVAIVATLFVILSKNPFYAVLYLILSLFGISLMFLTLGAPFLAALEIIVYAGAIMVLFLFVVQMLSPGTSPAGSPDLSRPKPTQLIGPGILSLVLLGTLTLALMRAGNFLPLGAGEERYVLSPRNLGIALFRHHYLGVELASLILLIGIIGGMHLGQAAEESPEPEDEVATR